MLDEKKGRVAIWIGTFPKKAQFSAYIKETYGDEEGETPINAFCADMGDTFYDHDFVFGEWHGAKMQSVEKLLSGWNHAHTFIAGALKLAKKAGITEGNTVMVAYNHELKPAKWPKNSPVCFLGNLPYSEAPPPLPKTLVGVLGHKSSASRLCFAPDGKMLVSGSDDGSLMAWNAATGEPITPPRYAFQGALADIYGLMFSADGRRCVAATIATTCVWDSFPTETKFTKPIDHFAAKAITPDGKLALASSIGKVWTVNLDKGKPERTEIKGDKFALLPRERLVTTSAENSQLQLWDAQTVKLLHTLDSPLPAREVAVSPSGKWAVTHRNDQAVVWDLEKRKPGVPISVEGSIGDVFVVDDDTWLLRFNDKPIQQRSLKTGKLVRRLGTGGFRRVYLAQNRILAITFDGSNIELWNGTTGQSLGRYPDKKKVDPKQLIDAAALSSDGQRIAIGLRSGQVKFLSLNHAKGLF